MNTNINNMSIHNFSPELLYRIFVYCDIQTILFSIRRVCRRLYTIVSNYNRFQLRFSLPEILNYQCIFHNNHVDIISSFNRLVNIQHFTHIHSLTIDSIIYETIDYFSSIIPSDFLKTHSIHVDNRYQYDRILSLITRFYLRKLVLTYLDIGICALMQYLTILEKLLNL